jgi:hypothetical protein
MIQGDRKLHSQRIGRNPQVRNDRRYNGHVREQAPSPQQTYRGMNEPGSPPTGQQMPEDPYTLRMLDRIDRMRQQTKGLPIADLATGMETGNNDTAQTLPVPIPVVGQYSQMQAQLNQIIAAQYERMRTMGSRE